MKKGDLHCCQVGDIGENYVLYKLATMGIKAMKVSEHFEFDLLTKAGKKIEVKTATKNKFYTKKKPTSKRRIRYRWSFLNALKDNKGNRKLKFNRNCDYFVFVCLNEDFSVEKSYVIPREFFKSKTRVSIGTTDSTMYNSYKERWWLLHE